MATLDLGARATATTRKRPRRFLQCMSPEVTPSRHQYAGGAKRLDLGAVDHDHSSLQSPVPGLRWHPQDKGDETMRSFRVSASAATVAMLALPPLAAAQTAPAIPPGLSTPDRVETRIG